MEVDTLKYVIYLLQNNYNFSDIASLIEENIIYYSNKTRLNGIEYTLTGGLRIGVVQTDNGFTRIHIGSRYDRTKPIDFYNMKEQVETVLRDKGIPFMEREEYLQLRKVKAI